MARELATASHQPSMPRGASTRGGIVVKMHVLPAISFNSIGLRHLRPGLNCKPLATRQTLTERGAGMHNIGLHGVLLQRAGIVVKIHVLPAILAPTA